MHKATHYLFNSPTEYYKYSDSIKQSHNQEFTAIKPLSTWNSRVFLSYIICSYQLSIIEIIETSDFFRIQLGEFLDIPEKTFVYMQ